MTTRFSPALMCLALLAAPVPSPLSAAELSSADTRTGKLFELLDENEDGYVSMPEFKNNQLLVFYLWDRNRDLVLTVDETPAPPEVFARVAGPSGTIDPVQFIALVDGAFKSADANQDGKLDRREFATLRQRIRE